MSDPQGYRGNTRAMDDMGNLIKAFSEERGGGQAVLESILNDRDRCGELILMYTAYVSSIWEQLPETGILWANARRAMKNERN